LRYALSSMKRLYLSSSTDIRSTYCSMSPNGRWCLQCRREVIHEKKKSSKVKLE
jgi:hypothetical protein